MNEGPSFSVSFILNPVQAEMLAQLVYVGLSNKLNAGWRRQDWLALASIVTVALELPRKNEFARVAK